MAARVPRTGLWETSISGMSGMGRKSLGPTGTFWRVALSRESVWTRLGAYAHREFGMQGYPNKRTVQAWQDDGDDSQYFPQSRVSANHNKAVGSLHLH
jgi:hypothetical protein